MYAELGIQPSALSVARHYRDILTGFVLDVQDVQDVQQVMDIQSLGMHTCVTDTMMVTSQDRARLAKEVVEFGWSLTDPVG